MWANFINQMPIRNKYNNLLIGNLQPIIAMKSLSNIWIVAYRPRILKIIRLLLAIPSKFWIIGWGKIIHIFVKFTNLSQSIIPANTTTKTVSTSSNNLSPLAFGLVAPIPARLVSNIFCWGKNSWAAGRKQRQRATSRKPRLICKHLRKQAKSTQFWWWEWRAWS